MTAIYQNWTSNLVPLHLAKQIVGYKWVYMVKFNPNGSVDRLKARLVAKTYTHTYGINYEETFSPAAKISYVRVFISLITNLDWSLFELDVKNALVTQVYMEHPFGFVAYGEDHGSVCRLKTALHGLRQSLRVRFGKFTEAMLEFGLHRCQTNHSIFLLHADANYILLVAYVNDIVIFRNDSGSIATLKQFL